MELITLSGQKIKSFEKCADINKGSNQKIINLLYKSCIKEAEIRNDEFMIKLLKSQKPTRLPTATIDQINLYMFGKTNYFNN